MGTVTVNWLVEGEYLARRFVEGETIVSVMFPELVLSVDEVVAMTRV